MINTKIIKEEIARFNRKLKDWEDRLTIDVNAVYGCKESGAIRRACLDLKNELTNFYNNKHDE